MQLINNDPQIPFKTFEEEGEMNNLIEINPEIMLGKPIIKGTRIPVELIVRKLGEGSTIEDLLEGYPNLSREAVQAALSVCHWT